MSLPRIIFLFACLALVIDTTATPESENSAADQSQIIDVSGAGPLQREVYRFQPNLPRRLFLGSIATPNLLRWKVDGLNWWQVILAFLAFLGLLGMLGMLWHCVACVCCSACLGHHATKEDDGSETDGLLSDTENGRSKSAKRHRQRGAEGQQSCPACGAPYIGNANFCHVCKRLRDYSGGDQALKSPPREKKERKEKKSKKERKERRTRSPSPNASIQMRSLSDSPSRLEMEQPQEVQLQEADAVYNMHADVYYSGQQQQQHRAYGRDPVPLPSFPNAPGEPPHVQNSSAGRWDSGVQLPSFSGAASGSGARLPSFSGAAFGSRAAAPGICGADHGSYGSGGQDWQSHGPRVIDTIVHKPVLERPAAVPYSAVVHDPMTERRGEVATIVHEPILEQASYRTADFGSLAQHMPSEQPLGGPQRPSAAMAAYQAASESALKQYPALAASSVQLSSVAPSQGNYMAYPSSSGFLSSAPKVIIT